MEFPRSVEALLAVAALNAETEEGGTRCFAVDLQQMLVLPMMVLGMQCGSGQQRQDGDGKSHDKEPLRMVAYCAISGVS